MNYGMSSGGPGGPPRMPLGKMAAPAHLTGLTPQQLSVRAPLPPCTSAVLCAASHTRHHARLHSCLRSETRSRLRLPPRSGPQRCPTQARPPPPLWLSARVMHPVSCVGEHCLRLLALRALARLCMCPQGWT